jgi:hypothetical protein
MIQTEWKEKYDIMLQRAKALDDIYGQAEDAMNYFLPSPSEGWFWDRKVPLYNIKLVRVPFLTKEALDWMKKVRTIEIAGGRKSEILKMEMI